MGRTSGFVIEWPVTFDVEDGRRFEVALSEDGSGHLQLRMHVAGDDAWRAVGESYSEQTTGAVIGRALRWWYETTGEPIIIAKRVSTWRERQGSGGPAR
jgi:hypothetical protein